MRSRDVLTLIGGLCLCVGVTILVFAGTPTEAGPVVEPATASRPIDKAAEPAPMHKGEVQIEDDGPALGDIKPVAADLRRQHTDTSGWTSGIICGDIQIDTSILDKIRTIQVIVAELRNPLAADGTLTHPFHRIEQVTMGVGTPTFRVQQVPFSPYGYQVRVYSAGLNGSQQTVAITAEHPYEDRVRLSILPGAPFSLLLRDQDQAPLAGVEAIMAPIGEPEGRPVLRGLTDNYGSRVFDSVLAGDYRVYAGAVDRPLAEPVEITVHPALHIYRNGQVQSQGTTIVVPRGVPLQLLVVDASGYGIADATVQLQATDRIKLTQVDGRTDFGGRCSFPHLVPGTWQIEVIKDGFQRRTSQVTLKDGDTPPEQTLQLHRQL
ncbi:MAG TPA: carboxypeptidase-like regulatory domain-containing protein [Planctomycetota bacterium]|nr:carboxypeptidase-like regulatory domain-containing protein [Planctomycetota bacterium]